METKLKIEDRKGIVTAFDNGTEVGDLAFKLREGGLMVITHTLTYDGNEGKGIGKLLVQAAVEYAQQQQLKIVPLCSFARVYIERHPELHGLMAE